jgi:2,5-diketo-D-gluconate reductase A
MNLSSCKKKDKSLHCEKSAIGEQATWVNSWHALERAYAEGRASSIGVSNFDVKLLDQIQTFADVLPHVVQNFAEPGKLDFDVRVWCSRNSAVFMPYSVQRNLRYLPQEILSAINAAAIVHGVSPNAVVLKFFLQTGTFVW